MLTFSNNLNLKCEFDTYINFTLSIAHCQNGACMLNVAGVLLAYTYMRVNVLYYEI